MKAVDQSHYEEMVTRLARGAESDRRAVEEMLLDMERAHDADVRRDCRILAEVLQEARLRRADLLQKLRGRLHE